MAKKHTDKLQGSQQQESTQSADQGPAAGKAGSGEPSASRPGIGSSQGQDEPQREERDSPERPSAGTPDIERGAAGRGSGESLVQDPVGAYKERP